jgi:hypothetical protein
MANTNAPFGFRETGLIDGVSPNFGMRTGKIAAANTSKIFYGDVLKPLSGGYYDVAAVVPGGEPVGGVAVGFIWFSKSVGYTVYRPYWPGNGDASGDVTVKINANPQQIFEVQALLGPITQASIGKSANINVGAGGQQFGGGLSSFSLDDGTLADSPTLPFKVYGLLGTGSNILTAMPGADPSTPYNIVLVQFNNLVV